MAAPVATDDKKEANNLKDEGNKFFVAQNVSKITSSSSFSLLSQTLPLLTFIFYTYTLIIYK
jgi:hypothetical protein